MTIIDDEHFKELNDLVNSNKSMIKTRPFGLDSDPTWILVSDIRATMREYQLKKLDI